MFLELQATRLKVDRENGAGFVPLLMISNLSWYYSSLTTRGEAVNERVLQCYDYDSHIRQLSIKHSRLSTFIMVPFHFDFWPKATLNGDSVG